MTPAPSATPRAAPVIAELLRRARFEIVPLPGIVGQVARHLPRQLKVTVTASPARGIETTLDLAERLADLGFDVVPHVSARLIVDGAELGRIVRRLEGMGVRDVFVVAGDKAGPAGSFEGSLSLLREMDRLPHPFREIGVAGYPEGHPFLDDRRVVPDLLEKSRYATYVASQLCFDARVVARWIRRLRDESVELPIYLGVPGVVNHRKLLRIAARIGVGESARFLRRHLDWLWRPLLSDTYKADRLIGHADLVTGEPRHGLAGFHIYTFNELERTAAWREDLLARLRGPG